MAKAERREHVDEKLLGVLDEVLTLATAQRPELIVNYVDQFRANHPGLTNRQLARRIVSNQSVKSGLVGAATGLGGLVTLPIAIPADLVANWRIQAFMAFSVAYVYGYTPENTDLKTDLYIILAWDAAKEVLKRFGIAAGREVTKRAVAKYITREVMKKIWKVLGQKIITKAGEKSLTSFMKLVPVVGAPIGYTFDWAAAKAVGAHAISYYGGIS